MVGADEPEVRFRFCGFKIRDDDTAQALGMEDVCLFDI
jgi:hypothetical protein